MKENVFGLSDCNKPGGGLCTLCCTLMDKVSRNIPRGVTCTIVTPRGCPDHNLPWQARECREFHCSQISNNMKYYFLTAARAMGLISQRTEVRAKRLWPVP